MKAQALARPRTQRRATPACYGSLAIALAALLSSACGPGSTPDASASQPSPADATLQASGSCLTASNASYLGQAMANQTGAFTAVWSATPGASKADAAVGLSQGLVTGQGWTRLGVIVRFNDAGTIDAMSGSSYVAANVVPYTAGSTYQVRVVVDVPSRTYSAYVTPPGGAEKLIASQASFRATATTTSGINEWVAASFAGSLSACLASVSGTVPSGPTPPTAGPAPAPPPAGVVPAFPGAEGGGALAKGGRGGKVIEVTNLNDSGAGSLRACVQASGARTCVFRVGGTIKLLSEMYIVNPYITIAGQTAPGDGIQIVGPFSTGDAASPSNAGGDSSIVIATHDVVLRYLRVRHGLVKDDLCYGSSCNWLACRAGDRQGGACTVGNKPDNVGFSPMNTANGTVENVIVDHVSSEWGEGKAFGAWNSVGVNRLRNVTIQWSVAAETLKGHSTSYIVGSDNPGFESTHDISNSITDFDWHHNLSMGTSHRHPLIKSKRSRFVNNLVYNWGLYATQIGGGAAVDVVSNLYKRGPMTPSGHEIEVFPVSTETASGAASLYVAGNVGPNNPSATDDNWNRMTYWVLAENGSEAASGAGLLSGTQYKRTQPLDYVGTPITVTPVGSTLESYITSTVGMSRRLDCNGHWVDVRDALDRRLIADYFGGTGPRSFAFDCTGSTCVPQSEIDSPEGQFPTMLGGSACTDSDHDGMPDAWEIAHGLNPNDPSDGPAIGSDGYSNLERYLAGN